MNKVYLVVRMNGDQRILCHTVKSQPAIYVDLDGANAKCAEMAAMFPHHKYAVVEAHAL